MKNTEYTRPLNISINMTTVAPVFIAVYRAWKLILVILILSVLAALAYWYWIPVKYQAVGLLEIGRLGRNIIEPRERMLARLKIPLSYTDSTLRSCRLTPNFTLGDLESTVKITPLREDAYVIQITASMSSDTDAKQCLGELVSMIQQQHRAMEKASWEERLPYLQNIKSMFFASNKSTEKQGDIQLTLSSDEFTYNYSTTRLIAPIYTKPETKAWLKAITGGGLLSILLLGIFAAIGRNFLSQHQQRKEST